MKKPVSKSAPQPPSTPQPVTLNVLGPFSLRGGDGAPIDLKARKCRQLLAYLAVPSGQARSREQLAALLWSDRQEEQARASLRTALSGIRGALGKGALVVEVDMVRLKTGFLNTDFDALKHLHTTNTQVSSLEEFYAGALMAGLEHDSDMFMEWLRGLRAEGTDLAIAILAQNADRLAEAGNHKAAINLMRQSLTLEPLKERTHRKIMQLYTDSGERAMALAQFRTCKEVLFHELNAAPDPKTQDLADRIAMRDRSILPDLKQVSQAANAPVPLTPLVPKPQETQASIAVLPFVNMSGDAEQSYFADGITEDITIDLSSIEALSVAAKTSSGMYRGAAVSPATVSEELGVHYLLQGSVRTAGQNVRIAASLIDARANRQLWAARYDRTMDDVFELQSEISAAIVAALKINLDLSKNQARPATASGEAYQIYLRAKSIRQSRVHGFEVLSQGLFARAISIDPNFALAHAAMAELEVAIVIQNKLQGSAKNAALLLALQHCEKALEIGPNLAEAHLARGHIYAADNKHEKAKACYLKAVALKPDFADAHSSLGLHYLEIEHDHERAFLGYQQAYLANPINCHCINIMAVTESFGLHKELKLYASQILILAKRRAALNPHDYNAVGLVSYAYRNLGEVEHARHWLKIVSAFEVDDAYFLYNLSCLYANLGSEDEALDLLERSLAHPQSSPGLNWIKEVDADMEPLRKNPRFYDILDRYFD